MRIFVIFENKRLSLDFSPDTDVKRVRDEVIDRFSANTVDNKKEDKILELTYGGGILHDDLVLQDIGIKSGTTIRASLQVVKKPNLIISIGYENNRSYNVMDVLDPIKTTMYDIYAIVSNGLGLPVTAFRLSKIDKNGNYVELFDCNTMYYYGIDIGSTLQLDVWDGWNELIRSAIQGHTKVIPLYLSWDEQDRQFQQKCVLYIAAYYGHIGLASAMLRAGARPDLPIGSHPTRRWCNTDIHDWKLKCPVHIACEKGHLVILRIFLKASILCLIAKDEQDNTPWKIVVRRKHKDCFGYLLARQWGRKNGKNFSIPILTYCHVLRWCERARTNTLLNHGTAKSTLKGTPVKDGALVGLSTVILDGYSTKPMNSKLFTDMPRPAMHPGVVLPALNKARRRFRGRQSSSLMIRRVSSKAILSKSASSQNSSGNIFALTESVTGSEKEDSLQLNGKKSVYISTDLPTIAKQPGNMRPLARGMSRVSFAQESVVSMATEDDGKDAVFVASRVTGNEEKSISLSKQRKRKKTVRSVRHQSIISEIGTAGGASVPLPAIPNTSGYSRPFYHWSNYAHPDPIEATLEDYRIKADIEQRQNAINCLSLASTFTKKPWLKQVDMAVCLAKRSVAKNTAVAV